MCSLWKALVEGIANVCVLCGKQQLSRLHMCISSVRNSCCEDSKCVYCTYVTECFEDICIHARVGLNLLQD